MKSYQERQAELIARCFYPWRRITGNYHKVC